MVEESEGAAHVKVPLLPRTAILRAQGLTLFFPLATHRAYIPVTVPLPPNDPSLNHPRT